eukprot:4158412-Pleurochrysis_carterae.AAC.6
MCCVPQAKAAVLILVAIALTLLILGAIWVVRSSWQPRNVTAGKAMARARRLGQVWLQLGMQSKVKQAIGFYQGKSRDKIHSGTHTNKLSLRSTYLKAANTATSVCG